MEKPPATRPVAKHKTARSRVTNGKELLAGIDGRTAIARRYADILAAVVADMGGEGRVSEAKLALIRRFAAACCLAEGMEAALVRGEPIDISEHSLLASTLVRIAQRIGLSRSLRDVTPTVADYLDAQHTAPEGVN